MNDSWKFFSEEAKEEALLAVVIREVYNNSPTWRSPDAHPKNNLYRFMLEAMQALLFHEMGKRISNHGAIRVRLETAVAHITLRRNCQLDWRRAMGLKGSTRVGAMQEEGKGSHPSTFTSTTHVLAYKVSYDPGNAAYASYMRYLIQDSDVLWRIFQNSSPSDEILGDGMEIDCPRGCHYRSQISYLLRRVGKPN